MLIRLNIFIIVVCVYSLYLLRYSIIFPFSLLFFIFSLILLVFVYQRIYRFYSFPIVIKRPLEELGPEGPDQNIKQSLTSSFNSWNPEQFKMFRTRNEMYDPGPAII